VEVRLWIVRGTVRHVIKVGIFFHHQLEYLPLYHREAGRRFCDLDETIGVSIGAYRARTVGDRVEWIVGVAILELAFGQPTRQPLGRPVEPLHRISPGGDIAISPQEAEATAGIIIAGSISASWPIWGAASARSRKCCA